MLAADLGRLKLAPANTPIYDAIDDEGRTYQIKSRTVPTANTHTSFDSRDLQRPFDFLICVLFQRDTGILLAVVQTDYETAMKYERKGKNRISWRKEMRDDSRVKRLYWRE